MTPLENDYHSGLAENEVFNVFIVEAIILTPFIFSIRYMVQSAKENEGRFPFPELMKKQNEDVILLFIQLFL